MKLHLPEGMTMLVDLVAATASTAPDLRGIWRDPDCPPVPVSNREQARELHQVRLITMIEQGDIVARSPLTRMPCSRDFEWRRDSDRYAVSWEDAQAFCRLLAIDLQPLVAAPMPTAEDLDAALLAKFRSLGGEVCNGQIGGRRGARAALARVDGRRRQTLEPILLRAAEREPPPLSPFASVVHRAK